MQKALRKVGQRVGRGAQIITLAYLLRWQKHWGDEGMEPRQIPAQCPPDVWGGFWLQIEQPQRFPRHPLIMRTYSDRMRLYTVVEDSASISSLD